MANVKSGRPTISDIAAHAGVSPSTVDRVLNSRVPVRGKTADRVLQAARELRYHGLNLLAQRIDGMRKSVSIGLMFQNRINPFFRELAEQVHLYADRHRPECRSISISDLNEMAPRTMAKKLSDFAATVDVLGVMAFDHPVINDVVATLTAEGKQVIAVLSNLSSPHLGGYVGIDHQKAGRTAGWALAKLLNRTGKVGMLIESYQYRAYQEREIGLRNYVLEHEPALELCEGVYGIASNSVVERMFDELLARHPELKGLYFVGAGVSAVVKLVEQIPKDKRPVIVCHELTAVTREALALGTVDLILDSPRADLARSIVDRLIESGLEPGTDRRATHVDFRIYGPENI